MSRTSDLRPQDLAGISCDIDAHGNHGRGVVVDKDGRVVTAAHVVEGARRITVGLASGAVTMVVAKISERYDVALLEPGTPLTLARNEAAVLGEAAGTRPNTRYLAYGPSDVGKYDAVISTGTISGRVGTSGDQPDYWQLNGDGMIRPGWSGSPLYDVDRNLVVGIVLETFTPRRGDSAPAGRAYAVVADVLRTEFGLTLAQGVYPLGSAHSPDPLTGAALFGAPALQRDVPVSELQTRLADAWESFRRGDCRVVAVRGASGSGKSTAVRQWLQSVPSGAVESVFWWTFSPLLPFERFLGVLLAHLGFSDPGGSPAARAAAAGAVLRRRRTLLILDNLEPQPGQDHDSVLTDLLNTLGAEGSSTFTVLVGQSTVRITSTGGFLQVTAQTSQRPAEDTAEVHATVADLALDAGDQMLLNVASVRSIPADIGDRLLIRELVLGERAFHPGSSDILGKRERPPDARTDAQLKAAASEALTRMCDHGLLDDVSGQAYPSIPYLGAERYRVTPSVRRWSAARMVADPNLAMEVHRIAANSLPLPRGAPRGWDEMVLHLEYVQHLLVSGQYGEAAEHISSRDLLGTLFWRLEAWSTAIDLIRCLFQDNDLRKSCLSPTHAGLLRHASALCLINLGEYDEARVLVEIVMAKDLRGIHSHQWCATLLLAAELWAWRGDVPRARRLITAAGAEAELSAFIAEVPVSENHLVRECVRRDGWICLLEGKSNLAVQLLRESNDTDDLTRAESLDGVLWLAQALLDVEEWGEATEIADRLLDLDPLRADLRVGALTARATATTRGGSRPTTGTARGHLDRAVVLARTCERPGALVNALTHRGALTGQSDATVACRDVEEALQLALRHSLLPDAVDARLILVRLLQERDPERSRWELALAVAEAEACGYGRGTARAHLLRPLTR